MAMYDYGALYSIVEKCARANFDLPLDDLQIYDHLGSVDESQRSMVFSCGLKDVGQIALKLFPFNERHLKAIAQYEIGVYKHVTKHIFLPHCTPGVMPLLGYGTIKLRDLEAKCVNVRVKSKFREAKEKVLKSSAIKDNGEILAVYLITPFYNSIALESFLLMLPTLSPDEQTESADALNMILATAFLALQNNKIQHNDVHMQNILVMQMDHPIHFLLEVTNRDKKAQFYVKTKYVPVLFDWSLGYVDDPMLGNPIFLDYTDIRHGLNSCSNEGLCDNYAPTRDVWIFMDIVSNHLSPTKEPWFYETETPATIPVHKYMEDYYKVVAAKEWRTFLMDRLPIKCNDGSRPISGDWVHPRERSTSLTVLNRGSTAVLIEAPRRSMSASLTSFWSKKRRAPRTTKGTPASPSAVSMTCDCTLIRNRIAIDSGGTPAASSVAMELATERASAASLSNAVMVGAGPLCSTAGCRVRAPGRPRMSRLAVSMTAGVER